MPLGSPARRSNQNEATTDDRGEISGANGGIPVTPTLRFRKANEK